MMTIHIGIVIVVIIIIIIIIIIITRHYYYYVPYKRCWYRCFESVSCWNFQCLCANLTVFFKNVGIWRSKKRLKT